MQPTLRVRELIASDIPFIVKYWTEADPEYLHKMGADPQKIPSAAGLQNALLQQISQDYREKYSYATIWLLDDEAIGHCNVNRIIFGHSAYMHLHVWKEQHRNKGFGVQLCKLSIPLFFANMQIQTLFCEPSASNAGPNQTLEHLGFELVKNWTTVPGDICYEQSVNLWELKGIEKLNQTQ
ncbi:MAG: GNAT family protein [Saprospiraceae bacterium]